MDAIFPFFVKVFRTPRNPGHAWTEPSRLAGRLTAMHLRLIALGLCTLAATAACNKEKPSWLTRFSPPEQIFRINPGAPNQLTGKRGTRLTIPANSFDTDREMVEVRLTEAVDGFDIAATGLPMHFEDELGQTRQFESAGMFRVTAQTEGRNVELKDGARIQVEFPNLAPGEKFRVYRFDGKSWKHDGHNQEAPSSDPVRREELRRPARPLPPRVNTVGTRIYEITALTWWNFDYPRVDGVCIKGALDADGQYQIVTIGRNPRGSHTVFSGKEFRTGALMNGDVTIAVISMENGAVGKKRIKTGTIWGNYHYPESPHNYCEDIGIITMEILPDRTAENAGNFRAYLEMPEEKYAVSYRR